MIYNTQEELEAAFPGMDREDADDGAGIWDYVGCLGESEAC